MRLRSDRRAKCACACVLAVVTVSYLCSSRVLQMGTKRRAPPTLMHLALVSCGKPNYQGVRDIKKPLDQGLTMMKSAVLFAKQPLHLHIFTEDDMIITFQSELDSWPTKIQKRVNYTIYDIDYDYDKHLPSEVRDEWKKWYKPCGSFRLFLPMALRTATDAAIYADSDVVFVKPVDLLWSELERFAAGQVAAISPTAGHPLGGSRENVNVIERRGGDDGGTGDGELYQINSGILVMNFTRMLTSRWSSTRGDELNPPDASAGYGTELLMTYYNQFRNSAEHDQKLLNIIFHFNPEKLRQLSCSWNFKHNFCQDASNTCPDAEGGSGAGAVHGIMSSFFGDVNPTFRALFEAFLKYDFELDTPDALLDEYRQQLDRTAKGTYCWEKSHVITAPLEKSIRDISPPPT